MSETVEQYKARIMSLAAKDDPVKALAAAPQRIAALLRGLTPRQIRKRPAPGKWSINEIVAHLADAEIVFAWRLRYILSASGNPVTAYDQNAWATNGQYEKADVKQSLEVFRVVRESNLRLYRALGPEQRERFGIHAERGQESIAHIIRMFTGHDRNHLLQIEAIRKGFKK